VILDTECIPINFVILYCTLISIAFHGGQLALRCRGGESTMLRVHRESVFASRAAVDKYSCLRFEYVLCKTTTFLKLSMSLLIFLLRFIPLYLNTTCKYLGQGESTCAWNRSNFLNIISLFTITFQEAGGDTSTFNRRRYMWTFYCYCLWSIYSSTSSCKTWFSTIIW